jgi:hypothetical protein
MGSSKRKKGRKEGEKEGRRKEGWTEGRKKGGKEDIADIVDLCKFTYLDFIFFSKIDLS